MKNSNKEYYELLTTYYIAEAKLLGYSRCAIVEAKADTYFWKEIFLRHKENPYFIYNSRTPSGNETSGVTQCLKFKDFAQRDFIICIDSDYRYLTEDIYKNATKRFILQTYTYSIENHYCHYSRFNSICKQACNKENDFFNFKTFTEKYSQALYMPFIWLIYSLKYRKNYFSKQDFLALVTCSYEKIYHSDIENDGNSIIHKTTLHANAIVKELTTKHPDVDLNEIKNNLSDLGVREHNVFLFIRGHNIFTLTRRIGRIVTDILLKKERDKLKHNTLKIENLYSNRKSFGKLLMNGSINHQYDEVKRINKDILEIIILDKK